MVSFTSLHAPARVDCTGFHFLHTAPALRIDVSVYSDVSVYISNLSAPCILYLCACHADSAGSPRRRRQRKVARMTAALPVVVRRKPKMCPETPRPTKAPSRPLSHALCLTRSVSRSVSFALSHSLCLTRAVSRSVLRSVSLALSHMLWLALCLTFCLTFCLTLCLTQSLSQLVTFVCRCSIRQWTRQIGKVAGFMNRALKQQAVTLFAGSDMICWQ